jgi:hypothetical protein
MESFADVVLAIEDRGVARKLLAQWGDVDDRTVAYWITGERMPSLVVLRRLLTKGNDVTRAGIMAFLTRGTGWVAQPETEASGADAVAAAADVVTQAAELLDAVVHRKPREVVEQEAGDVVRAANLVAGAVRPMRIFGNGGGR